MSRLSSEQKRSHIRHSAYLCFRQKGYYQTSIDDICRNADISKGSFYWHYGAKIDVYIDILENWARQVIDELLIQFEYAAKIPNRIEFLSAAFEQEFHRARAIVPLWVEFSLLARTDKEIQLSIGKFYRRARAAISEILRATTAEHLSEEEVLAASGMILGAYMGVVLQEFADRSVDATRWAQDFVGILRFAFAGGYRKQADVSKTEEEVVLPLIDLAEYLPEVSDEQREIFNAIRKEIFLVCPEVSERWISGWKVFGYYTNRLKCFVKIRSNGVTFHLKKGARPEDLTLESMELFNGDRCAIIESNDIKDEIKMVILSLFHN